MAKSDYSRKRNISENQFDNWCDLIQISDNTRDYLLSNGYNSQSIQFVSTDVINSFDIIDEDRQKLRFALHNDSDTETNGDDVDIESTLSNVVDEKIQEPDFQISQHQWKEFGRRRRHKNWENYLAVEMFSPDGFWSWNPNSNSQSFKNSFINKIWEGFDEGEPGWILGPPVLLPLFLNAFKLTCSLRIYPDDDYGTVYLELNLLNDGYNTKIQNMLKVYLNFKIHYTFISYITGCKIGETETMVAKFRNLHEQIKIEIPGRILSFKRPPLIHFQLDNVV